MIHSVRNTAVDSPYIGLRPFEPFEAELFFGRAEQVDQMLASLEQNRFLAVVGASGCGKSSVVRAGLLPALADGFLMDAPTQWRFAIARPGDEPFSNLARALMNAMDSQQLREPPDQSRVTELAEQDGYRLALIQNALESSRTGIADALTLCDISSDTAVLVLIDQFEELFRFRGHKNTSNQDEVYRSRNQSLAFVELLLRSTQLVGRQVYVLITMRSDFLGACDEFPGLPETICRSQFLIPRLTRSQMAEAISGPLQEFDVQIEEGFVNRVVNDTGNDRDQLPLMQHALLRTWQRVQENATASRTTIRIGDYEAVGELQGALDQHAEMIYDSLGKRPNGQKLQQTAEHMFCSLSELREDGQLTRRVITLEQAAREAEVSESEMGEVVNAFAAHDFLVLSPSFQTLNSSTRLDISHESLLRQWQRLQGWIESYQIFESTYRRLESEALDWVKAQYSPSFLLQGNRLNEAIANSERYTLRASDCLKSFLEQSEQLLWMQNAQLNQVQLPPGVQVRAFEKNRIIQIATLIKVSDFWHVFYRSFMILIIGLALCGILIGVYEVIMINSRQERLSDGQIESIVFGCTILAFSVMVYRLGRIVLRPTITIDFRKKRVWVPSSYSYAVSSTDVRLDEGPNRAILSIRGYQVARIETLHPELAIETLRPFAYALNRELGFEKVHGDEAPWLVRRSALSNDFGNTALGQKNIELLQGLCDRFETANWDGLQNILHRDFQCDGIDFLVSGDEVIKVWKLRFYEDMTIKVRTITATLNGGVVRWDWGIKRSQRTVAIPVESTFVVTDGKVWYQHDKLPEYRWARLTFGWRAWLWGWGGHSLFAKWVKRECRRKLDRFASDDSSFGC